MRVLKNVKYALICFLILVCEMTFAKYLEIGGVVPMLSFCACLAAALIEDNFSYIIAVPAILGVALDICSGHGFGTYTIAFTLASVASFEIRDKLFSSKVILLICNAFVMTVLLNMMYYLFHINDIGGGFGALFLGFMLPSALYNIAVSLIFYPILKKILAKRR
ncbi:MAG: rod shape-determining protein MreD [Clostridia bacterium]|nr:rod shape-determining protein MreD [Clostridia bacterium]